MTRDTRSLLTALAGVCAFFGCGGDDETTPSDPPALLEPPAAGEGIQLRMNTTIEPSTEVEHCQFFRAPPEGLNLNRDEVRFTAGSHHVLLYATPYDDVPTVDELGRAIDPAAPFDCSDGPTARWRVTTLLAGSQNATGESIVHFPPDVAMKVAPNAVLLMNVHYINTLPDPIRPEVRLNAYAIPDEKVAHEGGLLFFYDAFIRVDAHSKGLAKMSCSVPIDVTLSNAQSHMHRRGVDYAATHVAPDGARAVIYESSAWEGVPVQRWDQGLTIEAGSRIEYFCAYDNPEDRVVWQGPRTTDEMCMFLASYWPARPDLSLCSSDPDDAQGTQGLGATWIGDGAASCPQTLGCVQSIPADLAEDDSFHALTDCVLDARPESATLVSDALRCMATTNGDPMVVCESEIGACMQEKE